MARRCDGTRPRTRRGPVVAEGNRDGASIVSGSPLNFDSTHLKQPQRDITSPSKPLPIHAFLWKDGASVDLGTLGGTFSYASAINDRGTVVGGSLTNSGEEHGFRWDDGAMIDLGVLSGGNRSAAADINRRGQIVGMSGIASERFRAFLWDEGTMFDLGTLPGGDFSQAFEINEHGQIVGVSSTQASPHIFVWDRGAMIDLGTLPGAQVVDFFYIPALNNRGEVVGQSMTASGQSHAVLWTTRRVKIQHH